MVEGHCQKKKKKSKTEVFSRILLKQQLPRDFALVIAHKYAMPLLLFDHLCLGILTLHLPTGRAPTLQHFPYCKTGRVPHHS